MFVSLGLCRLELVAGDLTRQQVDAIANAANAQLAGGGGVDGAIHRAAGPELMQETTRLHPQGCPTGSAVGTSGGKLPARCMFHAVGPIWQGGQRGEPALLAGAHRRCLELAVENACQSLAFPAISTGVYGYPKREAARVALQTVGDFLCEFQQPALVRFVLIDPETLQVFSEILSELRFPTPRPRT
jgi:O-acetyl-ADP-ribose deacetylase (regulator of RNase III)